MIFPSDRSRHHGHFPPGQGIPSRLTGTGAPQPGQDPQPPEKNSSRRAV